jgi:hypothetical protein
VKIGIVVDGLGEFKSLPEICARLCLRQGDQLLAPVHARLQPKSAPGRIAESVLKKLDLLRKRGADVVLLLIDREDREDCAPEFAQAIEAALEGMGEQVHVVVKDRKFENWLIAGPAGLARLKGRFKPTKAFESRVMPNKADNVADATALLDQICVKGKGFYHKTQDPPRILAAMDVTEAGKNSRSFRRFLHLLGDKRYRDQSKKP